MRIQRSKKIIKIDKDSLGKQKYIILNCYNSNCSKTVKVMDDIIKVLCYMCTTCLAPPNEFLLLSKSKFPPGWKLMKIFVNESGDVFERGILNPDLKGKFEPTNKEEILNKIRETREKKKILKLKKIKDENDNMLSNAAKLVKQNKEKIKFRNAVKNKEQLTVSFIDNKQRVNKIKNILDDNKIIYEVMGKSTDIHRIINVYDDDIIIVSDLLKQFKKYELKIYKSEAFV